MESPDKTFMTFLNHQDPAKMSSVKLNTVSRKPSLEMQQLQTSIDVGSRGTRNTS